MSEKRGTREKGWRGDEREYGERKARSERKNEKQIKRREQEKKRRNREKRGFLNQKLKTTRLVNK